MRQHKKAPEHYTLKEVELLITAAQTTSSGAPSSSTTSIRNAALVAILYGSGLRVSEALALRQRDVDLERGVVLVPEGKTGHRTVIILPEMRGHLTAWVERRRVEGLTRRPLFCFVRRDQTGRIDRRQVNVLLARLAARTGLDKSKRVHPHAMRHSFSVRLHLDGLGLHQIQRMLGHASATTTFKYLESLGNGDVLESVLEHYSSEKPLGLA